VNLELEINILIFNFQQQGSVSSSAKHTLRHYVSEDASAEAERTMLQSHNSEVSVLAPTPSEDELMANLEWDEEDLVEYPETEEGGITIVAANTPERDMKAELSPAICNVCEEPQSMSSSRSFTVSPNTER
jgi:formylmethanofuran dehydrogenase subunit E